MNRIRPSLIFLLAVTLSACLEVPEPETDEQEAPLVTEVATVDVDTPEIEETIEPRSPPTLNKPYYWTRCIRSAAYGPVKLGYQVEGDDEIGFMLFQYADENCSEFGLSFGCDFGVTKTEEVFSSGERFFRLSESRLLRCDVLENSYSQQQWLTEGGSPGDIIWSAFFSTGFAYRLFENTLLLAWKQPGSEPGTQVYRYLLEPLTITAN